MKPCNSGYEEARQRIIKIIDVLGKQHGSPKRQVQLDPISVLIHTILSQNTTDTNSEGAFRALSIAFDNWEDLVRSDTDSIARCIRRSGLGRIKAQRIKQALQEIIDRHGQLELGFLSQLSLSDAEAWLQSLTGVGLKTARCVLLFSLGMPALPVDTHILRVTKRLGLLNNKISVEKAHLILGNIVPLHDVYRFHILLIEHGRKICRARYPDCHNCLLREECISSSL